MIIKASNTGFNSVSMDLDIDWDNNVIAIVVDQYSGKKHKRKVFAADELKEAREQFRIWDKENETEYKE